MFGSKKEPKVRSNTQFLLKGENVQVVARVNLRRHQFSKESLLGLFYLDHCQKERDFLKMALSEIISAHVDDKVL